MRIFPAIGFRRVATGASWAPTNVADASVCGSAFAEWTDNKPAAATTMAITAWNRIKIIWRNS
jgi:hypothetical protein